MPDLHLSNEHHVLHGNSLNVLPTLPGNSVDAIITDPPYELTGKTGTGGFMGHAWDATGIAYNIDLWKECLRVLKPGGHIAVFGATRTIHRVACAVEDAGFEIRDMLVWSYSSGMAQGLNVEKKSGNPAHAGLNTALKPAIEPIILARKPLDGTVVANVTAYGTGALNVDAARIPHANEADRNESEKKNQHAKFGTKPGGNKVYGDYSMVEVKNYDGSAGRWPANLLLAHATDCRQVTIASDTATDPVLVWDCADGCAAAALDQQAGYIPKADPAKDPGGPSRFFHQSTYDPQIDNPVRYVAKPNRVERSAGLDGDNPHSTVKPVTLMRYLIRLLCPAGGVVLDPFTGSGTTGVAAVLEDRGFTGIELTDEYIPVIGARLQHALDTKPSTQQLDLFG